MKYLTNDIPADLALCESARTNSDECYTRGIERSTENVVAHRALTHESAKIIASVLYHAICARACGGQKDETSEEVRGTRGRKANNGII